MISLARLVELTGITDDAELPALEQQRDAALAFIESQTGVRFGSVVSSTVTVRGTGTGFLYLREPVLTVTAVTEHTYPGATGSAVAEGGSGYALRTEGQESYLVRVGASGTWTRGYEYSVTYTHGYVEDAGPKDVEHLLVELVKLYRANAGREGINSETIGGYSYSKPATYAFEDGDLKQIPGAYQTIKKWRRLVYA